MKKSLIALAALAATASFAQSTISISGLVDLGYQAIDAKGSKYQLVGNNGSATTAFVFAGTEDLGAGLKAEFRWEIDPALADTSNRTGGTSATGTTNNSTTFVGNGASFVGASGDFGAIKFGTPNSATLSINGDGNGGFGTAIGSGYRVSSFDAVRFQNSLRYDTPSFNGFSASYVFSPKNDKQANAGSAGLTGNLNNQTNGRDQVNELGLAYVNGPLAVRYANLQMKQYAGLLGTADPYNTITILTPANLGAAFKIDSLSAKYAVNSALNVSYFYQKVTSDTLSAVTSAGGLGTQKFDRTTNGVAASYAITPALTAMVNYQAVKNGADALATSGSKANRKGDVLGLGLDYALSKRTTAYVRYERDGDKDNAGFRSVTGYGVAGNYTYTATAVGLRHTF